MESLTITRTTKDHPMVVTSANAEGAIEGDVSHYALKSSIDVESFKYGRYFKNETSVCAPRDITKLSGHRTKEKDPSSIASIHDTI